MSRRISRAQARRIALAAQGFSDPKPAGKVDVRHIRRVMSRLNLVQLDSVNVIVRSHYMPFFSRLGPYRAAMVDEFAYRRREVVEQWGHEASFIPVDHYHLLRYRMEGWKPWGTAKKMLEEDSTYFDEVLEEIRRRGALSAGELEDPGARTGPWWGYAKGKHALEWLFAKGVLAVAERRNFTRYYDDAGRVIPGGHLPRSPLTKEESYRELLLLAARSHGVGTAKDLGDYHRLHIPTARNILSEMVEAGDLEQVEVEGWKQPAYLHPEAREPRKVRCRALLSPFDSLIWERSRTERLFDFRYRIEIYVPAPKRVYGYYVMPFLLDEQMPARVDLKAARQEKVLLVRAAHIEEGADRTRTASQLAAALREMADWLGLAKVNVARKGNLASELRKFI